MRKLIHRAHPTRHLLKLATILLLIASTTACQDSYEWAEEKPAWLGESIYEELSRRGEFNIFLQMIDDLGQDDFLKKTGSVTVFVPTDDAYRAYFDRHGIDQHTLTPAMKKYLVNSAMLENAYVLDLLTNQSTGDGIAKGQVMRRTNTEWSAYDSIPAIPLEALPPATPDHDWWARLRETGQTHFNVTYQGVQPMVHFLWRQMSTKGITKQDFSLLFGGKSFSEEDTYINNVRVKEGNITCQNGYIHIMEDVPTPLPTMTTHMASNGHTNLFARLVDRFSVPLSATQLADRYAYLFNFYQGQDLYSPLWGGDSIYYKSYLWRDAEGNGLTSIGTQKATGWLKLNPGQMDYAESKVDPGVDMGAIFAPNDTALRAWWNSDGGLFLRQRYPSAEPFDSVPDDVLAEFINNHIQYSFLNTLPSKFKSVLDDAKDPIGFTSDAIVPEATGICCNGALYVMDKVYAPSSFRSVIAPTLVEDNMKIMRWAIRNLEFKPYLLSMVSYYNFIIFTDDALQRYVDPVTYNTDDPRWFQFRYNEEQQSVDAYTYSYDKTAEGDAAFTTQNMRPLTSSDGVAHRAVTNRLTDLLDFAIIPRDVNGGNLIHEGEQHLITKDNGVAHIIKEGEEVWLQNQVTGQYLPIKERVEKDNGYYLIADHMVQPTMQSLQQLLEGNEAYTEFYELLLGNPEWTPTERNLYAIMKRTGSNTYSMNRDNTTVKTFNSYQYTVYIPDNEAMQKAYAHGLPRWSDINALSTLYAGNEEVDIAALKHDYTMRLLNFIKYHLQDNSLYVGGAPIHKRYETAAYVLDGVQEGISYSLQVESTSQGLTVTGNHIPQWSAPAVITATQQTQDYNQLVREYTFDGENYSDLISTSSYAVVHRVSEPLIYDEECLCIQR